MNSRNLLTIAAVVLGGAIAAPAWGITFTAYHDPNLFGKVSQLDQDISELYGDHACAPTSTINSFVYLMSRYGLTGLIEDMNHDGVVDSADYVEAVIKMGNPWYMRTSPPEDPNGTIVADMVRGKSNWVKEYNDMPGTVDIVMGGQSTTGAGGLLKTPPTWQFIYEEVRRCEDVEVGFAWTSGGGHAVTVTDFYFDDTNNNGKIDPGEDAKLSFIDPWGGVPLSGTLSMSDGNLFLSYKDGAGGTGATGRIIVAISESPVPEPLTMLGVLLGVTGVFRYVRKRVAMA